MRRVRGLLSWRRLLLAVLTVAPMAVLGVVLWRNRETLFVVMRQAHYAYFVGTFLFYGLSILVVATGWHLILHLLLGGSHFFRDVQIYVYTLAARRIPGTLWYIAGRAILYERVGISKQLISVASGIEVVVSIVAGLVVGSGALIGWLDQTPLYWIGMLLTLILGLVALHPFFLTRLLRRFGQPLPVGEIRIARIGGWLIAYAGMWVTGGLMAYTILAALYPVPLREIPLVISLWSMAGVISFLTFLLPNTLGLSEISLSLLFSRIVPLEVAITTALLVRVLTTIFDIGWSSLYFLDPSRGNVHSKQP